MEHKIKINRACKLAKKLPRTQEAILQSLSDDLIASLTSKQIASVMQALDSHWQKATSHCEQRIIGDGCVWSQKHNALLDIVYPTQK